MKLDQWESKEGEKRSAIRVVLDNFEFVDSKQDGQSTGDRQPISNSKPHRILPPVIPEVSNEPNLVHLLILILMKMFLFKLFITPPIYSNMPNTEILLVEPVDNLGSEGDIVKVRPGYARNFLFPKTKLCL